MSHHHLFRDLLCSDLEHREPGLAPELNRRAMAWCQANGMPEPALHYAHAAGETDALPRLFEELVLPTYYAGGVATIESWLDWYDDEQRGRYPTAARPPSSRTGASRSSRGSRRCAPTRVRMGFRE